MPFYRKYPRLERFALRYPPRPSHAAAIPSAITKIIETTTFVLVLASLIGLFFALGYVQAERPRPFVPYPLLRLMQLTGPLIVHATLIIVALFPYALLVRMRLKVRTIVGWCVIGMNLSVIAHVMIVREKERLIEKCVDSTEKCLDVLERSRNPTLKPEPPLCDPKTDELPRSVPDL